jgi:hypothetical protein
MGNKSVLAVVYSLICLVCPGLFPLNGELDSGVEVLRYRD